MYSKICSQISNLDANDATINHHICLSGPHDAQNASDGSDRRAKEETGEATGHRWGHRGHNHR